MKIFRKLRILKLLIVIFISLNVLSSCSAGYSTLKHNKRRALVIDCVTWFSASIIGFIIWNVIRSYAFPKDNSPEAARRRFTERLKKSQELRRVYMGCYGCTLLHMALRLDRSIDHIKKLIENGVDVNAAGPGPNFFRRTLFDEIRNSDSARKKGLSKLIIENGAQISDGYRIKDIVEEDILQKQKEINDLLLSIKRKNTEDVNRSDITLLLRLIEDKKTPVYDKQTAIQWLFSLWKNQKLAFLTHRELKRCLKQMQFNYRFFNCREFSDIVGYVLEHDLTDIYGKSILYTSAVYGKCGIVLRALMKNYNDFSYSSNSIQKKYLRREIVKTFGHAKRKNRKLYAMLRNIEIVWGDLKNISGKKRRESLESAVVGKIINFTGSDTFRKKKVYFS